MKISGLLAELRPGSLTGATAKVHSMAYDEESQKEVTADFADGADEIRETLSAASVRISVSSVAASAASELSAKSGSRYCLPAQRNDAVLRSRAGVT